MELLLGNCLDRLKDLEDNSVDAIVTDPPYGLSFMGKKWDYDVPSVDIWKECLRVLKPGGYLLSFAGTRTQHRMAVNIEDAGFEIRDMIAWVYGSGFPKSLNVGKSVNQLETNEWSKIGKALDNIDPKSIMDVWKTNAKPAGIQLSKSLTEVGSNTPKKFFVPDIAVLYSNQKNELLNATIAEMRLKGLSLILEEDGIIAVESAGQTIELLPENARLAVKLSESQNLKCWNIFTAQCDVKEWLNENTEVNLKVDEALKTLRGNKKYSNEEITNVLCAELTDILKLTILNQSKTFQNLDTNQKTECVSAINVIITEYTAECLISNTVDILKSKAVDKLQGNERQVVGEYQVTSDFTDHKGSMMSVENSGGKNKSTTINATKGTSEWEGWGTALKPALEPITVARKPLGEKTVAENCLKWGVGGINIDGSRVPTSYNSDDKVSDNTLDTFPSQKLYELRGKLYTLLLSSVADKKDCQSLSSVDGYVQSWKVLQDCLGDCSVCLRLYDVLSPLFLGGDQVPVQQLHDVHDDISRLQQEQSDNPSGQDTDHLSSLGDFSQLVLTYLNDTTPNVESKAPVGRFPANLIHDGSDEVVGLFPQTKSGGGNKNSVNNQEDSFLGTGFGGTGTKTDWKIDSGSASRFFYCAKASKRERNKGLENMEKKAITNAKGNGLGRVCNICGANQLNPCNCKNNTWILPKKNQNNHPTVKPIALMEYLVKLVSREGQVILDPFMGSGTTGMACKKLDREFIGIEMMPEYMEIAKARIEGVKKEDQLNMI